MTARTLRLWSWLHKWTSLVCTAFMLLLCLTGLPLIFHHEIGHLTGSEVEAPPMPEGTALASMDDVVAAAQARHPRLHLQFVFREPDEMKLWMVSLGETPQATEDNKVVAVDARTAAVLAEPRFDEGFMYVMFKLHVDLFAGLPGTLFLGFMGLLLAVAIVSGVVLYGPFMRRLDFGTVRHGRSAGRHWLDLHNLLGVVTLVWAFAVAVTGVINTLADPMVKLWQYDQMTEMIAPYAGRQTPAAFGSLERAIRTAAAREPGMNLGFVAYPGTRFSSPHHYAIFMRGTEPLTARLFKPVLVDAATAEITDARELPWYMKTLLVSQPLHFGDYGGLPLKILWALLDLITIVVLWSGLVLWWRKRNLPLEQPAAAGGAEPAVPARQLP